MSRSGRLPILIPSDTEVRVEPGKVHVKGPKGSMERELPETVEARIEGGQLLVSSKDGRLHGLYRALLANMVTGCARGHEKELELIGVGFRAAVRGSLVDLQLGFSHPKTLEIPEGLTVAVEKNTLIKISGCDAQRVGQFAADIRDVRPPEPYKGKGARYRGEHVRRKAGKAGKK